MTVSNFNDLKSRIVAWAGDRTDLLPETDEFILLAESIFENGNGVEGPSEIKPLRTRQMEASDSITLDTNAEGDLPADYLSWRNVTALTTPRAPLDYATPEFIDKKYPYRTGGYPKFFTIVGSKIRVLPISSGAVEFNYYQRIPALSDTNNSNWLLQKCPNAYLFTAVAMAFAFLQNSQKETEFTLKAIGALKGLQADDRLSRWSKTTIQFTGAVA